MARIRTIKPEFWVDEKVVEVSHAARLLFIGLWNFADDDGRMEYSPKKIKMQIFPADNLEISALIGEIRGEDLITIYVVENVEYLQINNFSKHQKVDRRTASKLPPPRIPPNPPESPRIPPSPPDGSRKGREGNIYTAFDKAEYKTKKGKLLKEKQLQWFEKFWITFGYPRGKREAADAWLELKVTEDLFPQILAGAKRAALDREKIKERGGIPKMAQGWLSGRRWEDGSDPESDPEDDPFGGLE